MKPGKLQHRVTRTRVNASKLLESAGYCGPSGSGESWFTSGGLRLEPRSGNSKRHLGLCWDGAIPIRGQCDEQLLARTADAAGATPLLSDFLGRLALHHTELFKTIKSRIWTRGFNQTQSKFGAQRRRSR